MKGLEHFPLLVSVLVSLASVIVSIISESTGEWATISESGTKRRVPWQTNTTVGLWTSCTSHVSGFPREEVYTSECFPSEEGSYFTFSK